MTIFINHRLVLNIDLVAAIYPKPNEPSGNPSKFRVILKDVHVAASGHHQNFNGPVEIEVSRIERDAIVKILQGELK